MINCYISSIGFIPTAGCLLNISQLRLNGAVCHNYLIICLINKVCYIHNFKYDLHILSERERERMREWQLSEFIWFYFEVCRDAGAQACDCSLDLIVGSIPTGGNELYNIFNIFISPLWFQRRRRWVPSLNTQCLHNLMESW